MKRIPTIENILPYSISDTDSVTRATVTLRFSHEEWITLNDTL